VFCILKIVRFHPCSIFKKSRIILLIFLPHLSFSSPPHPPFGHLLLKEKEKGNGILFEERPGFSSFIIFGN